MDTPEILRRNQQGMPVIKGSTQEGKYVITDITVKKVECLPWPVSSESMCATLHTCPSLSMIEDIRDLVYESLTTISVTEHESLDGKWVIENTVKCDIGFTSKVKEVLDNLGIYKPLSRVENRRQELTDENNRLWFNLNNKINEVSEANSKVNFVKGMNLKERIKFVFTGKIDYLD